MGGRLEFKGEKHTMSLFGNNTEDELTKFQFDS